LANKYAKRPVFLNSLLADLLLCSTVVVTICFVLTHLNLFICGYEEDTLLQFESVLSLHCCMSDYILHVIFLLARRKEI
jgi:hypothetical protein